MLGCNQLLIFDHSLGESDAAMFKTFFAASNNTKLPRTFIFYYKKAGYDSLKERIQHLSGKALKTMTDEGKIRMLDIDDAEHMSMRF